MNEINYLAGGSNSPIPNWDNYPKLIQGGEGALVFDTSGKKYIDLWMGYGALIFGHAPPFITEAIQKSVTNSWFFSYPTLLERQLAEKLHQLIPCAERVRFATTGSDAVAYAVRAARAHTGRHKVIKVSSSYHGVHENLVSNRATISNELPESVEFNKLDKLEELLKTNEYSCVILEPILANGGTVPPQEGYLQAVKGLCTLTDTILIFDEVVTGFRVSASGAQKEFNVTPDIATFSKAVAGGLPLSAICGKKEILENFMPSGDILFAGTFNGSPLSLAVALSVINELENNPPYTTTNQLRENISHQLQEHAQSIGLQVCIQGYGSMLSIAFGVESFISGIHSSEANEEMYIKFADYMAGNHNLLLPPLYTETIFLSPVHLDFESDIIEKLKDGLNYIKKGVQ